MEENKPANLKMLINEYFNNRSLCLPTTSFSQLDIDLDSDSLFIALSMPYTQYVLADINTIMMETGLESLFMQSEKVDDEIFFYIIAKYPLDTDAESLMDLMNNKINFEEGLFRYSIINKSSKPLIPLTILNNPEQMVVLPYSLFHTIIRTITNGLGSGGDYILFMSGMNAAKYFWDNYGISAQDDIEEQLLMLEEISKSIGFGTLIFEDIDPLTSRGTVNITNPLEPCYGDSCDHWNSCEFGKVYRARNTTCTFTRGFLTEMLRRIFDDNEIELIESKCVTKNYTSCSYELSRGRQI